MTNQLAYLVKRANGRYYARFQQLNGRWTHESLGTVRAAEAKVLFQQWKERQLRAIKLEAEQIAPVTLQQLASEHLKRVENHQALSWHVKQKNYLENYILPFFGASTLNHRDQHPPHSRLHRLAQIGRKNPGGHGQQGGLLYQGRAALR